LHGIRPVIERHFIFFLRQDNGHSKNHPKKDTQFREPGARGARGTRTTEFKGWRIQYEPC